MSEAKPEGLALLRVPFAANHISKLPKPTISMDEWRKLPKATCAECGAYHPTSRTIHLSYVGHAALTDRLLDADPNWTWEPLAYGPEGFPALDSDGGMWIKLTVCGVTRLGYGDAQGKIGGNATKERIGDCLVRGTEITTARGVVPIEAVVVGDLVPTRNGWRPVTDHWLSATDAPMLAVTLSNGSVITGTPHHTVPTVDGEKRLDALRNGDMLYEWHSTENLKALKTLNGAVAYTGVTRPIAHCIASVISWQQLRLAPTCIEIFTNSIKAQFRAAVMFITQMRTTITTLLKISSRLIHQSILHTTLNRNCDSYASVTSAGANTLPCSNARAGAALLVRSAADGVMAWPMSSQGRQRQYDQPTVTNAGNHSGLASLGQSFAAIRVEGVTCAGRGEVWNISVGDTHEYVANGVLVKNSLRNAAMRFGAALELWHKGELHVNGEDEPEPPKKVDMKITPTAGAKDNVSPEERQHVLDVVSKVRDWITADSYPDAAAVIDEEAMSVEEGVYFWTFFDSKERTKLKLEGQARRKRVMEREAASQA